MSGSTHARVGRRVLTATPMIALMPNCSKFSQAAARKASDGWFFGSFGRHGLPLCASLNGRPTLVGSAAVTLNKRYSHPKRL